MISNLVIFQIPDNAVPLHGPAGFPFCFTFTFSRTKEAPPYIAGPRYSNIQSPDVAGLFSRRVEGIQPLA